MKIDWVIVLSYVFQFLVTAGLATGAFLLGWRIGYENGWHEGRAKK